MERAKKQQNKPIQFRDSPMQYFNNSGNQASENIKFAQLTQVEKKQGTRRMDDDDGVVYLTKAEKEKK